MTSRTFKSTFTMLVTLAYQAEARFVVSKIGQPLSRGEIRKGETGFQCLKELFGDEGEHVLTQNPTAGFGIQKGEEVKMSDQERYEAIFLVFGKDGIETLCDTTNELRRARLLTRRDTTERKPKPQNPERRAQACVPAIPLYPASNDVGDEYNKWAAVNVDPFLPDGADRTSRTDANKLVTKLQDSIDVALEAQYASMACRPIFDGIKALVSIPDLLIFQQGSIVGGLKSFVCGFGSSVADAATTRLYKQLELARFHDAHIDGAEEEAAYMNTANMANQVCTSGASLASAVDELEAIKRKLETRRA